MPESVAGIGKTLFHFSALVEGPDGDAYIPRWDINPGALSKNDIFGFVMQKVVRRWWWCPFVYLAVGEPIEVDSLAKWHGIKALLTGRMRYHAPHADSEGRTGLEG
jgi:hypothetical protein